MQTLIAPRAHKFLLKIPNFPVRRKMDLSEEHSNNKCGELDTSIDRINALPEELRVLIISRMPIQDAIATSLVSCRWRYLWKFSPSLDFDVFDPIFKVVSRDKRSCASLHEEGMTDYVDCVYRVIALHKNLTLEGFRVFCNLTKQYASCIDDWILFALTKKVQRLELNLKVESDTRIRTCEECYTFQLGYLGMEDGHFSNFKYLKKLSLNYVNVDGEALELLVCKYCPLLEDVSVSSSGVLLRLTIVKPFPSFKHLEITGCYSLRSVEIRDATNLVYLKYAGSSKTSFVLRNVPLLFGISVRGLSFEPVRDFLLHFSNVLGQLGKMEIHLLDRLSWKTAKRLHAAASKLSNLKHLVVNVRFTCDFPLLPLTELIRDLPSLERFVLKLSRSVSNIGERHPKKTLASYPRLKVVEFSGYEGATSDLEFVVHFLENADALEKVVVDRRTCTQTIYETLIKDEALSRDRAIEELPTMILSHHVVILSIL